MFKHIYRFVKFLFNYVRYLGMKGPIIFRSHGSDSAKQYNDYVNKTHHHRSLSIPCRFRIDGSLHLRFLSEEFKIRPKDLIYLNLCDPFSYDNYLRSLLTLTITYMDHSSLSKDQILGKLGRIEPLFSDYLKQMDGELDTYLLTV